MGPTEKEKQKKMILFQKEYLNIQKQEITEDRIYELISNVIEDHYEFDEFDMLFYSDGGILEYIEDLQKSNNEYSKKEIALYLLMSVRKNAYAGMDGSKGYVIGLYQMEKDLLKIIKPYINTLKIFKEKKGINIVKIKDYPYFFTVKVVRNRYLYWQKTEKDFMSLCKDDEI